MKLIAFRGIIIAINKGGAYGAYGARDLHRVTVAVFPFRVCSRGFHVLQLMAFGQRGF
jgi:hypothetical protein